MVCLQYAPNGVLEIISTQPSISTVVASKLIQLNPRKVLFIHNGVKLVTENWENDLEIISKRVTSVNSKRLQRLYGN